MVPIVLSANRRTQRSNHERMVSFETPVTISRWANVSTTTTTKRDDLADTLSTSTQRFVRRWLAFDRHSRSSPSRSMHGQRETSRTATPKPDRLLPALRNSHMCASAVMNHLDLMVYLCPPCSHASYPSSARQVFSIRAVALSLSMLNLPSDSDDA